jgi:hypothetical protein
MDAMSLLKAVPAVIGIAGLLTYFVRARQPESDLELANKGARHLFATRVRSVNHPERVSHSPACPSRSRYSLAAGKRINDDIEWLGVEIEQVINPSNPAVAATGKPLVSRKASFRMLTLYDMDRMTEQRAGAFLDRLEQAFRRF